MWTELSYRLFPCTVQFKRRSSIVRKIRPSKSSGSLWTLFVLLDICTDFVASSGSSPKSHLEVDSHFPKIKCETELPMCECYDSPGKAGLICRNVTDFGAFDRTLKDRSVFKINTTYEITLKGSQNLPRGFLKDLIVYDLIVDNPGTQGMDKLAFEGILHLAAFHVRVSSLTKIPYFRTVRDSLRNLNFKNSLLISLDGNELKDLPLLEVASFANNSIVYVAPYAFQGTNNVVIFDVSWNRLTWLHEELFDSWTKLKTVRLSHNNLLHVNHLFNITHPQFIYLDYNNLTDLDSVLHPNMIAVETLQLSYNLFSNVTVDSFNGKVNKLQNLYLDHCVIREFDVSHYQNLSYLKILDLTQNKIEKVTGKEINFGDKLDLIFSGNNIREFNAELSSHVDSIDLNKNLLTSLGQTLQLSEMSEVSIADNRIGSLGPEDFRGVQGIQALHLQGNVITQVGRSTFAPIRMVLEYLDLSRNLISSLDGCVRSLSSLQSLNLTDNLIENFEEGEFSGLNELVELFLEGNWILTLGNELQGLAQLKYLVISHNRIQTIKKEQIPENLQLLYLAGNPFKCDCELFPFLQLLNSSMTLVTDVSLCTDHGNYSSRVKPPARCPDNCRCHCSSHVKRHFMMVNCSSTSLNDLPGLFRMSNKSARDHSSNLVIYVQRRVNKNTIFPGNIPFVIEDKIGGLDISNNNLQSLEDVWFPAKLWNLFMSNNRLLQLPSVIYSMIHLSKISLSGNPWSCNCETLTFKKWIVTRLKVVLDADETRCSPDDQEAPGLRNRTIWPLTDLELCPSDINLYLLFAFVVISLLLVLAVCFIAYTCYHNSRGTEETNPQNSLLD